MHRWPEPRREGALGRGGARVNTAMLRRGEVGSHTHHHFLLIPLRKQASRVASDAVYDLGLLLSQENSRAFQRRIPHA